MPQLWRENVEAWRIWTVYLADQYDWSEVADADADKKRRLIRRRFRWETAALMVEQVGRGDRDDLLERIAVIEAEHRRAKR